MLATDGAIAKTTTVDNTEVLDLHAHGDKLYALTTSYPAQQGAIARFDQMLAPDTGFTSAEAAMIVPVAGILNGALLAVAADGSLIVADGKTLARFHADGSVRSTLPYMFDACGIAFDSHGRPLVAASMSVLRLAP